VLVDRGGRELPIHADIVGERVEVGAERRPVEVLVPELDGRLGVDLVRRWGRGDGAPHGDLPRQGPARAGGALARSRSLGILDTAEPFKEISERPIKKVPVLRGKTIVNAFFENSTRTRISFEFAEKRLSADTVNFAAGGSSVSKGETLVDTARNLEAMRIDMVVIRHGSSGRRASSPSASPPT
jgi:hypothetical protein